jgi:hypothetical protein
VVLEDVHALSGEQIDVDRVEAGPVVELHGRGELLYARGVRADRQSAFLFDEPLRPGDGQPCREDRARA